MENPKLIPDCFPHVLEPHVRDQSISLSDRIFHLFTNLQLI